MDLDLLFLDIDGVLNAHEKLASGYCGILADKVALLNAILDAVPTLKLVISSAWRYQVTEGAMTLKGFEVLLLVHGIKCRDRIHGTTDRDPVVEEPDHMDEETWYRLGLKWRPEQIAEYVRRHSPRRYVVVDDLPLTCPHFVQTDKTIGLTRADAASIASYFGATLYPFPTER